MKALTRVLVMAMLSAPFVATADDTGAKAKTTDTSKTTSTTDTTKPEKLKDAELQVMAHYHELNQMEIDLNKTAAKKATTQGVKDYANMLVKDHTDADKQLMAIAKKTGQKIPAEKPASDVEKQEKAEDKKMAAKIKTMKGADFERQFLQFMVTGHEKEVAKIDANMAKAENAELADSLKALKPTLQKHADEARSLQSNTPTASAMPMEGNKTGSTTTTGTAKTGSTTGSTSTSGTATAKNTTSTSTGSTNPSNKTTGTSGTQAQKAPPPTYKH